MADNVTINTTNIATDDVAGVHFQKMKLDVGGDGVTVPATGDASNGLDVDVTRVQGTVSTNVTNASLSTEVTNTVAVKDVQSSTATSTNHSATTSSSTVLAANANRREATIVNDSDTTIYLGFGAAAVAGAGVRLNAAGGTFTTYHFTGSITAIHSGSGSKNLTVLEV